MFYEIWAWVSIILGMAMCGVIIYFLVIFPVTRAVDMVYKRIAFLGRS